MVKFETNEFREWEQFRMGTNDVISNKEFELVCHLHSKYHKHSFYKPCTCNPKVINQWIKDLNIIWDNGHRKD
tara:strand:+ start:4341 stop:4559 length:219 start_codon:yes stop_codon:yes gene_type:complete